MTCCLLAAASDFLDPFEHLHLSQRGTPYIHSFGIEPAFTGRDLFLDQSYREGNGVTEHESELELEWAFTKRLGVIMEFPYIWEDEEGASTASGFGDFAIAPGVAMWTDLGNLWTLNSIVAVEHVFDEDSTELL